MTAPRIGELFSGYGGLGMGVQAVYGGTIAWHSDIDKGACKILTHRYPGVPNLGDITTINWSAVEPVDILTGGSPCQDLSHAGRRAGMAEGTRSNLWVAMREAIAQLRPSLVVWENVRGAYSAEADSAVEPCPGCVGDGSGVSLRALGRVLGDLSDLGYDARWHGLRAADIGAPHGRFRVFVIATDPKSHARGFGYRDGATTPVASGLRRREGRPTVSREARSGRSPADLAGRGLLPTPRATDGTKGGPKQRGSSGDLMLPSAVALLPTPAAQEPGGTLVDYHARLKAHDGRESTFAPLSMAVQSPSWGDYKAAIGRWETTLGRLAPAPTKRGMVRHSCGGGESCACTGNPQLSPVFVEWLMGLPAGWVTGVPDITRNEALKALGNGVVPQQAAAALRVMASWQEAAA